MNKNNISEKIDKRKKKSKFTFGRFALIIYLAIFLIIIIVPILWMFSLSLKRTDEITLAYGFLIPRHIQLDNYARAIVWARENTTSVPMMYRNSIAITFISVAVTIVVAALSAFAFSKLKFKGSNTIYYIMLVGMMIPLQVIIIPIFILNRYLGIINTYFSLILPYIAFGLPISIFILRGFFAQIPKDFSEAAKMDGASEFRIFFSIIIPLSKPALATCVIFLFLQNWNEFTLALVLLLKENLYTIPVALSKMMGEFIFPWEIYSALVFITAIPIIVIFLIFQNWFIKGLTAGAIKG